MILHTSLWLQLNWVITVRIHLIWHHLFSVPQYENNNNTWLGSSIEPMVKSYLSAVEYLFDDQDESFYTTGIQALQHRYRTVWTTGETTMYVER